MSWISATSVFRVSILLSSLTEVPKAFRAMSWENCTWYWGAALRLVSLLRVRRVISAPNLGRVCVRERVVSDWVSSLFSW